MSEKPTYTELEQRIEELKKEVVNYKQTEKALLESEERFRHLSEASFEAIVFHDEGVIFYANDQYYEMFDYTPEELAGIDAIQLTATPDSIIFIKHQISLGDLGPYEVVGLKKDGTEFPIEVRLKISKLHGLKVRMAAIRDLTEYKQVEDDLLESESRFRLLLEQVPNIAIQGYVADGTINYWNQANEAIYGYSSEEALGKNLVDLIIPSEMKGLVRTAIATAARTGVMPPAEELKLMRKDGSLVDVFSSHAVVQRHGHEPMMFCFDVDITERKQAEAEKKKLEFQLRQAHKMEAIGTMAGGIAHDFNNILAAIVGYADMAKDDIPDSSPAKKNIEQVLKASHRAKDLVRHILRFSRISVPVQGHGPIELSHTVKEVLKFQRSIIPTTISIITDIDENCGQIKGDSTQIHQVLMNFCTNASHAMEEKGGTLEIGLHTIELSSDDLIAEPNLHADTYIQLSVRDTGTGVTSDLMDKIFDPYFTTKEVGKGSGMGLAVVQSIVTNHDGFVKVESELGKGSTFRAFFPKIKEDITVEATGEANNIPTGTERILFVDDEEMLADIGKSILERLGYSVTARTDSTEALKLFKSDPSQFDLVITDQTMPKIPGTELTKQLLQIRPGIPIILCTGHSSMIDEEKAQKIGIREYTMKPVNKTVIAKLIRKALDSN